MLCIYIYLHECPCTRRTHAYKNVHIRTALSGVTMTFYVKVVDMLDRVRRATHSLVVEDVRTHYESYLTPAPTLPSLAL